MTRALKIVDVYRLSAQLSGDMFFVKPNGNLWGHVYSNDTKKTQLTVIHPDLVLNKIGKVFQDKAFKISSEPESFQIDVARTSHNLLYPDQIILTRTQGNEKVPWKKFTVKEGSIDYSIPPTIDISDGCTTFTFHKVKKNPGCFSGIFSAFKRVFRM